MKTLGARIKELRTERDLTMDMLVKDMKNLYGNIKMDKSTLSRWESGENDPTLENAKYLSLYFNVSVDYLIGLTDTKTPSRLWTGKPKTYVVSNLKAEEIAPNQVLVHAEKPSELAPQKAKRRINK